MISKEEISAISFKKGLASSQVEKDYVLGWLLAAISQDELLGHSWVFKGGTCIRKCYHEDYRLSEDLDFTIIKGQVLDTKVLEGYTRALCQYVNKHTGIEFDDKRLVFEEIKNPKEQAIFQGRIYYKGPASPSAPRQWPRIKFDLTTNEVIVEEPVRLKILHPYSDLESFENPRILTYSFYDLLAEKIRALFERTRPRDLYDVVQLFHSYKNLNNGRLSGVLRQKCLFKKLDSLDLDSLKSEACESGWVAQLSHQLADLPPYHKYFNAFKDIYSDLKLEELFNK